MTDTEIRSTVEVDDPDLQAKIHEAYVKFDEAVKAVYDKYMADTKELRQIYETVMTPYYDAYIAGIKPLQVAYEAKLQFLKKEHARPQALID